MVAVGWLLLGAPDRGSGMEAPRVDAARGSIGTAVVEGLLDRAPSANLVASPPSIDTAIAVLRDGAAGATRKTLDQLLPAAGPPAAAAGGRTAFATSLWTREGLALHPGFGARVKREYAAEVRTLPSTDAAAAVNRWASQATRGRIREVVDRVDPSVRLLLASAAWFRGAWRDPFSPGSTRPARFARADGGAVDVPTMSRTDSLAFRGSDQFRSVQLPFAEGREVLELVLPAPGVAPRTALRAALAAGPSPQHRRVKLSVPRFDLTYRVDLGEPLVALGLGCLFDPLSANLSGIAGAPGDLFVGRMRHDAVLRVDEAGAEAAAVTTAMLVGSLPPEPAEFALELDRPFLAILRASPDGPPVFIGWVASP